MMRTIFDEAIRQELIERIYKLDESGKANWGKMNLFQMLTHCCMWDEWILGKKNPKYKQEFIGFIFGKMALRNMIKDDRPLSRNVPTSNFLKIRESSGDIPALKTRWAAMIQDYGNYSNPGFIHDFFGKITEEQIGILAYKHTDHHLRQFEG